MLNANANAGGNGKPVFTYVKYTKQYLDPEPRQKIDYYVNDWENYKKTENEKGIYVEFEDKYVEEGNVKYKKIKRQFPMSEYKKEIDDLNKSSDLNKSNVSENASVNPENNVVLTLKDEEKDEKKETIEIRAGKNKNDAESAKEEKDNNKDEIVKKEIIKIKNNETHIITEEKGEKEEEIEENNSLKLDKTSITFTLNKLEIKNSGNGKEIDGLNQNNVREDEYDKEDGNDEGEENDSKTEIVNLVIEQNNSINQLPINKNQKEKMPSNTTLDIASLVKNSESFADFCNKLTETYKGIDLNKLDFRPVKLRFLNYCKAFFWTCVDLLKALFGIRKMNVDCGILLLTRLRVFFENAKFEGKTYCFEVPKTGNTQSHHSNKAQYEQNIDWLSSQIEKTKEQASKKPPGIDSNSRNLVK